MKIDNNVARSTEVNALRGETTGSPSQNDRSKSVRSGDSVTLSTDGSVLADATAELSATLDSQRGADDARVQDVRAQIENGSYPIRLRELANKLLEDESL